MSEVAPERVSWLWPGWLARGKLAILDGDPAAGKSALLTDLAARCSRGGSLPDGHQLAKPASVVILSLEDGIADTLAPRLHAAGADLSRVFAWRWVAAEEGKRRTPQLPRDAAQLEQLVRRNRAELVVIDPLMACLDGGVDTNNDRESRSPLLQLAGLAERTGAVIVAVRHLNKSGGSNAMYRGGGSIAFTAQARVAWLAAKDQENPSRSIVAVYKSNLAASPAPLAYRVVNDTEHGCARLDWEGATSHRLEQLLEFASREDRSLFEEAQDFLRDTLAAGPRPTTEVMDLAARHRIGSKVLRRAKEQLRAESLKVGRPGEEGQHWIWRLPEDAPEGAPLPPEDAPENPHESPKVPKMPPHGKGASSPKVPPSQPGESSAPSVNHDVFAGSSSPRGGHLRSTTPIAGSGPASNGQAEESAEQP